MPLPQSGRNVKWPPPDAVPDLIQMMEHAAWYSGDPAAISRVYSQLLTSDSDSGAQWWRFSGRNGTSEGQRSRAVLHVPLAGEIAAVNAAMLFGENPKITIAEAHDDPVNESASRAETRLIELLSLGDFYGRMSDGAEQASAIGGVYLKIAWDRDLADFPFVVVQQADSAIPEFKWGRMVAVTFWRKVEETNSFTLRHLERHERGVILHGLYRGSRDELGVPVSLQASEQTADLQPVIRLPFNDDIVVRYVPNMRPNRMRRDSPLGRSDYAGIESLLDALDETYSSWARDIRLAKARIIVPAEYLKVTANSDGSTSVRFDADQEVFTPLDIEPGNEKDSTSITLTQFAIRAAEHEQTAMALIERAVAAAGYSPQTFGLNIEGRADSGTALRLRERRSQITRSRKAMLWQEPLADILLLLMRIGVSVFADRELALDMRPSVEIQDGLPDDDAAVASTVELIARAGAASVETMVRMLHPEWDQESITAEVQRIRDDTAVPDPLTFGNAVPGQQPGNNDPGQQGQQQPPQ